MGLKALTADSKSPVLGSQIVSAVGDLGAGVSKAWSGVNEAGGIAFDAALGDIGPAADFIKGIPVSDNFTIAEFFDAFDDPFKKDGTNKALEELTGINIWNTVEGLDPRKIDKQVAKERVNEFIAGLEKQVVNQLKSCLDGYLQELLNKNPDVKFLLDIEGSIINEIGKFKLKVRLDVQDEIDKLLYDKIKLQQVALMRQELTKAIRKICPSHHSPPPVTRLSPSLTRKLQDDRSWEIVDGVNTLEENIRAADADLAYYAQQPDSTALKVVTLSKEAVTNIHDLSVEQTIGNIDKSVFDYVSSDGDLV